MQKKKENQQKQTKQENKQINKKKTSTINICSLYTSTGGSNVVKETEAGQKTKTKTQKERRKGEVACKVKVAKC